MGGSDAIAKGFFAVVERHGDAVELLACGSGFGLFFHVEDVAPLEASAFVGGVDQLSVFVGELFGCCHVMIGGV